MENKREILKVVDLQKKFHKLEVLKGISTTFHENEVVSIIGPSGGGKSTFLRCLNLLEQPTSGQILFDGTDICTIKGKAIDHCRQRMGMVFQQFNLFSNMDVMHNLTAAPVRIKGMSQSDAQEKALELLAKVGLADRADAYPSQLSGGQKQRVGIARALASNPKVLLCDEATSALDPQTTKSILELLQDINKKLNLTIVLITHQMEVVKTICDRVAVIENGDIIEEGSMVDVFTNPQHPTTKEFTKSVINAEIPEMVKNKNLSANYTEGSKLIVRLSFIGDSAGEPIVSGMVKRFDVDVSILYGNIDQLKDVPFGTLIIEISGTEGGIKNALEYLHQQNLKTEVIGYES